MNDVEVVREALLFSTRCLGRLGNLHRLEPGDADAWRVPDEALNAFGSLVGALEAISAWPENQASGCRSDSDRARQALHHSPDQAEKEPT